MWGLYYKYILMEKFQISSGVHYKLWLNIKTLAQSINQRFAFKYICNITPTKLNTYHPGFC